MDNEYKYLIENYVNKNIDTQFIIDNINNRILNYICYRINNDGKYPFIEIILEKIPYCNNLIEEEFILPSLMINNSNLNNIEELIIEKIKKQLESIGCNTDKLTNDNYLGITENYFENIYAIVNISNINIKNFSINRNSQIWFSLPTEIVNNKSICNIPINNKVIELFNNHFSELGILFKKKEKTPYPLPDILYSINDYNTCKLEYLLGRNKTIIENKGYYRTFYRCYKNIYTEINNNIGLNRYAVFIENYKNISRYEFNILNTVKVDAILQIYNTIMIQNVINDDTIIIKNIEYNNVKYDTLIRDYVSIQSLSYHKLTNNLELE